MKRPKLITFASETDADAIALAMLGQSNRSIAESTGLSDGQINYRLAKGKRVERNEFGYRIDYRSGRSELAQRLMRDVAGVLRAEVQRSLPKLIGKGAK